MFDLIAFDADDTLWDNMVLYLKAEKRFAQLYAGQYSYEEVKKALFDTEMRNLRYFGYGIKSFTLSMIETAAQLNGGAVPAATIEQILTDAKNNTTADIQLLQGVQETVAHLSGKENLMILTKGDLMDQEAKIERSGIAGYFKHVEIVSDKNAEVYRALLDRHGVRPERFMMIGNSLRSDVLPVAAIGAVGVYVPYSNTWAHEREISAQEVSLKYHQVTHVGEVPALIESLSVR